MTAIKKGLNLREFPADYSIVDIETTGLSPRYNEIIEISALKIRNDVPVAKFSSLVKPEHTISKFITELTGISNEMVADAPSIKDILPEFLDFVEQDCIVGHNVNFDINFIYNNLFTHFNRKFCNNYVDTMYLAQRHCKLNSYKLDFIAKQFNISTEGHHRALNDCTMTYEIYKRIKQLALDV